VWKFAGREHDALIVAHMTLVSYVSDAGGVSGFSWFAPIKIPKISEVRINEHKIKEKPDSLIAVS
jgi:hypothetical protein